MATRTLEALLWFKQQNLLDQRCLTTQVGNVGVAKITFLPMKSET